MPIQMVCDSTPSLVSAALRDALHSANATTNGRPSATASGLSFGSSSGNGVTMHGSGTGSSTTLTAHSNQNKQTLRRSAPIDKDYDHNDDGGEDEANDLVESICQTLRHGQQVKPITYEEGPSYSASLDKLKSKYIVLKAAPNDVSGCPSTTASSSYATTGTGLSLHASKASTGGTTLTMNGGSPLKFTSSNQLPNASKSPSASTVQQNGVPVSAAAGRMDTSTLPTPKRTLFSRDNVQIGWKTTGRKWLVGAGMMNMGNTCYLNSTLQALFHVPAIANWLLSDEPHRAKCDDGGSGGSCIICAMAKTLLESQSNQTAFRPYLVYSKLRLVCKHLVPGRQEDAHEFLRYLVEAMEKSFLGRSKNNKELDQYSKETTPLNQILGGYLRSEVKCPACQHVSTTFQHFEDLLLDIRKANSIDEALELYFARERLEEMGYKCEACKRRVAATKQFSLERAPFVLCVQLKRFSMLGGKINKHVELRSKLDLTPYSSPALRSNGGKLAYRLTSMVTHLGSTQHCGHYTAIGHTDAGGYHVFDDSSVRPIGIHNVMSTNAYILFYELESVAGAIGMPNGGTCRPKATVSVGQPSSTATLTSMGHLANGGTPTMTSGTAGIGTGGGTAGGGSGGTPGKAINSSPLRVLGTGSVGGHIPSKLESKPGFIGPVLPTAAASSLGTSSVNMPTSGSNRPEKGNSQNHTNTAKITSLGMGKDTENLSSPSSTTSSLSTTSPLCSPSKQHPLGSIGGNQRPVGGTPNGHHNGEPKVKSLSTPLLSSLPKFGASSAAKTSGTSVSVISLVPYDSDDTSSTSEDENTRTTGKSIVLTNGGSNLAKRTFSNGKQRFVKPIDAEPEQQDDEDEERASDLASSHSPQMIKTKAGLWKVSKSSTADQLSYPDSGSSKSSSPATSGGSSPTNHRPSPKKNGSTAGDVIPPLTNGHNRQNGVIGIPPAKHRPSPVANGYHANGGGIGGGVTRSSSPDAAVQALLKYSHRGYGAPVKSWNGQPTAMERELESDRREERKRQAEDDREMEMDRGRIKKTKATGAQIPAGGPNMFQQYQNGGGAKWSNGNRNNGNQFHGGQPHHPNGYRGAAGGGYYNNGNGHRNYGGFRNGGGRRFGSGRNGGGFHTKAHHHHQQHHHQRSESGSGMAGGGTNGFYHR